MVLLHYIIEILQVPDDDGRLVSPIVVLDSGSIAATLINGDLLREPLVSNSLTQEGRGGVSITSGREQKVYRAALFIAA